MAGIAIARRNRPHVVLVESARPEEGMNTMAALLESDPGLDIILISEDSSAETAVEAIKKGACDYLAKPISESRLRQSMEELLSSTRLRKHSQALDEDLIDTFQFEGMIGRSPAMLDLFRTISRVARHCKTILLTGETGTGKELAAKALHRRGPRSAGPFIVCNCSAWAESLIETELFGCVKGAYTDAIRDRQGVFEYANGGTLMLDEIGDMPLPSQAKLLRVLQNGEIQRVGSPVIHKVDVHVIAATSRNLPLMIAENTFRTVLPPCCNGNPLTATSGSSRRLTDAGTAFGVFIRRAEWQKDSRDNASRPGRTQTARMAWQYTGVGKCYWVRLCRDGQ